MKKVFDYKTVQRTSDLGNRIWNLANQGFDYSYIAQELRQMGYTTKTGKPVTANQVRSYFAQWDKEEVTSGYQADTTLWDKAYTYKSPVVGHADFTATSNVRTSSYISDSEYIAEVVASSLSKATKVRALTAIL